MIKNFDARYMRYIEEKIPNVEQRDDYIMRYAASAMSNVDYLSDKYLVERENPAYGMESDLCDLIGYSAALAGIVSYLIKRLGVEEEFNDIYEKVENGELKLI